MQRFFTLAAFAVVCLLPCVRGDATVTDPQAELDWLAYEAINRVTPPKPPRQMTRLDLSQFYETLAMRRRDAAVAFIEKHPTDPRRWDIVFRLAQQSPRFVKDWGPLDEKGVPSNPVIDEAAAAAWKSRVKAWEAEMAKATDLTDTTRRLVAERTEPKPQIYDPNANAAEQIRAAVKEAHATGKHVLVQVGGQWCIWCLRLHKAIAADAELTKLQNDNFVVVHVNYSRENKNERVLADLGFPQRFGFPVLVVLDGEGKRIHTQATGYLEEGSFHSKAKVTQFFEQWSPKALDPQTYEKRL